MSITLLLSTSKFSLVAVVVKRDMNCAIFFANSDGNCVVAIIMRLLIIQKCQRLPSCSLELIQPPPSNIHVATVLFLAAEVVCIECSILPAIDSYNSVLLKGIAVYSVHSLWILRQDRDSWRLEQHFLSGK
jgi:hypothetical protein